MIIISSEELAVEASFITLRSARRQTVRAAFGHCDHRRGVGGHRLERLVLGYCGDVELFQLQQHGQEPHVRRAGHHGKCCGGQVHYERHRGEWRNRDVDSRDRRHYGRAVFGDEYDDNVCGVPQLGVAWEAGG